MNLDGCGVSYAQQHALVVVSPGVFVDNLWLQSEDSLVICLGSPGVKITDGDMLTANVLTTNL